MCVRKVHKLRDVLRGAADYELGGKHVSLLGLSCFQALIRRQEKLSLL